MIFQVIKLRWLPLLAAAVLVGVSSGRAQPPATNAWQPVVFSSSSNTEVSSNLMLQTSPSPSSLETRLRLLQDRSPVSFFANPAVPAAPMAMPIPTQRFKRPADDHVDWEFMSPAEILGVASDQILKTQKRDANDNLSSMTPMERFLERQDLSRIAADTADKASALRNSWNDGNGRTNTVPNLFPNLFGNGSENTMASAIFNPYSDNAQNNSLFTDNDSSWSKLVGTLKPVLTPDPVQDEQNINEFLRSLDTSSTPIAAATAPVESTLPKVQTGLPDSDSTTPLADSIGASLDPLKSGIGKPADLAPLPGITQQTGAESATRPAWAPQPPPWLSPTPQPFAIPQRKF